LNHEGRVFDMTGISDPNAGLLQPHPLDAGGQKDGLANFGVVFRDPGCERTGEGSRKLRGEASGSLRNRAFILHLFSR
jgi:hypothetical protein